MHQFTGSKSCSPPLDSLDRAELQLVVRHQSIESSTDLSRAETVALRRVPDHVRLAHRLVQLTVFISMPGPARISEKTRENSETAPLRGIEGQNSVPALIRWS